MSPSSLFCTACCKNNLLSISLNVVYDVFGLLKCSHLSVFVTLCYALFYKLCVNSMCIDTHILCRNTKRKRLWGTLPADMYLIKRTFLPEWFDSCRSGRTFFWSWQDVWCDFLCSSNSVKFIALQTLCSPFFNKSVDDAKLLILDKLYGHLEGAV